MMSQTHPEEEEEQVAVALPDRVADPGAEVVERLHAAVRDRAVLRPQRPHDLAAHAQLAPVTGPQSRRVELPVDRQTALRRRCRAKGKFAHTQQ